MKAAIDNAFQECYEELGENMVKTAREQLRVVSHGRKHHNLPNVSSLPGDAPNNQTGAYSRTIRYDYNKNEKKMTFGAGNAYAINYIRYLEDEDNFNRPNISTASEKEMRGFEKIVGEKFQKVMMGMYQNVDGFVKK